MICCVPTCFSYYQKWQTVRKIKKRYKVKTRPFPEVTVSCALHRWTPAYVLDVVYQHGMPPDFSTSIIRKSFLVNHHLKKGHLDRPL